jgi:hypothetical protein
MTAASVADRPTASALSTAISLWRAGRQISMTTYAALVEDGHDVPSLQRFYFARKLS